MPNVIYVDSSDVQRTIDVADGVSVMQGAVANGIDGIVAECGGNAMCATCHVYVDEADLARLAAMTADEDALLDGAASERRESSRLSCQIVMTAGLDGLVVHLPERQV